MPKVTLSDFTPMGQPQTITYANGVTTTLEYTPDFSVSKLDVKSGSERPVQRVLSVGPLWIPAHRQRPSAKWSNYTRTSSFESARLGSVTDSRISNGETYQYDAAAI
ncbi:hypothetical protein F2981_31545 (plasmid) [Sinorhizobium meliloti]|nr:hypothetical protein [Sinorhizobium meliloti]